MFDAVILPLELLSLVWYEPNTCRQALWSAKTSARLDNLSADHLPPSSSNRELCVRNSLRNHSISTHPLISYIHSPQSWPMHLAEEQQQVEQQAELAEASALEATEAETVDEEGAEDVEGLAVEGTRAKRRIGNQ